MMKARVFRIGLFMGLVSLLILCSCKKQESVPGPQGDKGLPGDTGNVFLSETIFSVSTWSLVNGAWETTFKSGAITNNAVVSGEVDVLMQRDNSWWALPNISDHVFFDATFEYQTVHLKCFMIHGGPPPNPGTLDFRLIILEPVQ